jgi:hypothetical protein
VVGREHRAGASEPGRDLVEDQQRTAAVGQIAENGEAVRVVDVHAAGSLQHRFDDDRGELVGVPVHQRGDLVGPAGDVGVEAAGRPRREQLRGEHPGEHRVHAAHRVAHAHRPERVAVVGAAQCQHSGAPRCPAAGGSTTSAAALVVLQGHLQRDLDRDRSRVGQEDTLQAGGGDVDQPLAEADRGLVRQSAEHHVGHLVDLRPQGVVEVGVAVAVDGAPPGRHRVDDLPAVGQPEAYPLRAGDQLRHQRIGHRRVRVPQVLAVEVEQLRRGYVVLADGHLAGRLPLSRPGRRRGSGTAVCLPMRRR